MSLLEKAKDTLQSFYMGKLYPVIVVLLMFCAYTTSTEAYINVINLLLLSVGLLFTDSLRPLIPVLISYLYQFSPKTAMPTPEGLEALFSGTSLYLYIISFSTLIVCFIIFFIKNKLLTLENLRSTPLLISGAVLLIGFIANGAFSDRFVFTSTLYGLLEVFTLVGIFYNFYVGLKNDNHEELVDYLDSLGVPRIVYVSCNPDTLARDCAWFAQKGYIIGEVTPVDLFPGTGHVESVVCLTRRLDVDMRR